MSGRTIETNLRDKIYAMLVYAEVVEISWKKKESCLMLVQENTQSNE